MFAKTSFTCVPITTVPKKTAADGYGRPAFLAERVKIDGGQ
jgi:hypothetical protein